MVEVDGIPQKVLTLDWFKKPDCTDRMCLHTVRVYLCVCLCVAILALIPTASYGTLRRFGVLGGSGPLDV